MSRRKRIAVQCMAGVAALVVIIFGTTWRTCRLGEDGRLEAVSDIRMLLIATRQYALDQKQWPPSGDTGDPQLLQLFVGSNPLGEVYLHLPPSCLTNGFLDPWGNSYHLRITTNAVWVWSNGKNMKNEHGNADDISIAQCHQEPVTPRGRAQKKRASQGEVFLISTNCYAPD